jgi:cell division protease FtsH
LYGEEEGQPSGVPGSIYSADTAREIDIEVRKLLDDCYGRSVKILEDNKDILYSMKDALMDYETIDSEQVDDLMQRKKVRPPYDWDNSADNSTSVTEKNKKSDNVTVVRGPAKES